MNAAVPAPCAMWPDVSRNNILCGLTRAGTRDQYIACAITSATPDASSTADVHGPSWWEPMITQSSDAPGSDPTTLYETTSSRTDSTVMRTCTGPRPSMVRNLSPSEREIHTPGIGRSTAHE